MRRYVSAAIGTLSTLGCMLALSGTAAAADNRSVQHGALGVSRECGLRAECQGDG